MLTADLPLDRFNRAFAQYLLTTQRDLAEALNRRAFFIALRALKETPRADRDDIARDLGGIATRVRRTRAGKYRKVGMLYAAGRTAGVPLAALIVQKKRGQKGEPGLQGPKLDRAIARLLAARVRSIGFHRAGYLPALQQLASLLGDSFSPQGAKQRGAPKGSVRPAVSSENPAVTVINSVRTIKEIGDEALQRAFTAETAELERHVEQKLRQSLTRAFA